MRQREGEGRKGGYSELVTGERQRWRWTEGERGVDCEGNRGS